MVVVNLAKDVPLSHYAAAEFFRNVFTWRKRRGRSPNKSTNTLLYREKKELQGRKFLPRIYHKKNIWCGKNGAAHALLTVSAC